MMRWITSHWGLKLTALMLALGIVFIKAQEKISTRIVRNVAIRIENIPPQFRLPDAWVSPMVQMRVYGSKNVIDAIQPDFSKFVIDLSSYPISFVPSAISIIISPDMFRTNLDADTVSQFWIDEVSITPLEIVLQTKSWNINTPLPKAIPVQAGSEVIEMSIYRIEKNIPVQVPTYGEPPDHVVYQGYEAEPKTVTFTGRKEALDQIQSVSTITLDLSRITVNTLPIFLPLEWQEGFESKPVDENIQEVTVTLSVRKK